MILRRTPREVYRVCTEEELFAEEAPFVQEWDAASATVEENHLPFAEEFPTAELSLAMVPARSRARLAGVAVLTAAVVVASAIVVHALRRPERRLTPLAELPAETKLPRVAGSSTRPSSRISLRRWVLPRASRPFASLPRASRPYTGRPSSLRVRHSVHADPVLMASTRPVVRTGPPARVGYEFGFER